VKKLEKELRLEKTPEGYLDDKANAIYRKVWQIEGEEIIEEVPRLIWLGENYNIEILEREIEKAFRTPNKLETIQKFKEHGYKVVWG